MISLIFYSHLAIKPGKRVEGKPAHVQNAPNNSAAVVAHKENIWITESSRPPDARHVGTKRHSSFLGFFNSPNSEHQSIVKESLAFF